MVRRQPRGAELQSDPQFLLEGFSRAALERTFLNAVLTCVLAFLAATSLATGPVFVPFADLLDSLRGGDNEFAIIINDIRLPRTLLSILVGASLGLCGASAQSLTRNPLADPSIFGAPQAAALGAVLLLYFGWSEANSPELLIASVGGAAVCLVLILLMVRRRFSVVAVLLAGLALGSLCSAGLSMALSLSPNPFAMAEIVFWLMGSFADRSLLHVILSAPLIVIGCAVLLSCGRAFRALSLGEDTAISMGFSPSFTTSRAAIGMALTIGAATAVSGAIGFVGLMAPHLARPFCSGDPKAILVPSMLAGAILTTAADIVVRIVPSTNEIPVGVVTALLGAPFFLYLVTSRRAMFGSVHG